MINDLNTFSEEVRYIGNVPHILRNKARSFLSVGNKEIAQWLCDIADDLQESHKKLDQWIGKEISTSLRQAEESTNNMFMAALAGAGIALKPENK